MNINSERDHIYYVHPSGRSYRSDQIGGYEKEVAEGQWETVTNPHEIRGIEQDSYSRRPSFPIPKASLTPLVLKTLSFVKKK